MGLGYYWLNRYITLIFFLIYVWNKLPDQVPGHYNAQGEVDRMGSKFELLLLPGIGLFMTYPYAIFRKTS